MAAQFTPPASFAVDDLFSVAGRVSLAHPNRPRAMPISKGYVHIPCPYVPPSLPPFLLPSPFTTTNPRPL